MNKQEFQIIKGAPLPKQERHTARHRVRSPLTKALMQMVEGDSIVIPLNVHSVSYIRQRTTKLGAQIGKKYATRSLGKATGVWCVADTSLRAVA